MDSQEIIALRKAAGLTQAALAKRVGVSQGHIADIERNRRVARGSTLLLLKQIQNRYKHKLVT